MNANRQLINLVGAVLIVAALALGILLIAIPLATQSQATDAQTRTESQANAVYEAQLQRLSAADARISEIDANLASLRAQIPATAQLDDVFELIDLAVSETGATIESIKASDPSVWAPRPPALDLDGSGLPTSAEDGASTTPAETPAETPSDGTSPAPEGATAAPGSETAADEGTTAAPAEEAVSPQRHVVMTVEVAVPDAAAATRFLDVLRSGTRLVLPVSAKLEDGVLTVSTMSFVRMEDPS